MSASLGSLEEALKELEIELQAEPNNFFATYWKVSELSSLPFQSSLSCISKAVVLCEIGKPETALPMFDQVLSHLTEAKLPAEELADFHFCKAFPCKERERERESEREREG
jgi:hypothetical protein